MRVEQSRPPGITEQAAHRGGELRTPDEEYLAFLKQAGLKPVEIDLLVLHFGGEIPVPYKRMAGVFGKSNGALRVDTHRALTLVTIRGQKEQTMEAVKALYPGRIAAFAVALRSEGRKELIELLRQYALGKTNGIVISPTELWQHGLLPIERMKRQTTSLRKYLKTRNLHLGQGGGDLLMSKAPRGIARVDIRRGDKTIPNYHVYPPIVDQALGIKSMKEMTQPEADQTANYSILPAQYVPFMRLKTRGLSNEVIGEILGENKRHIRYVVRKSFALMGTLRRKEKSSIIFNRQRAIEQYQTLHVSILATHGRTPTIGDIRRAFQRGELSFTDSAYRYHFGQNDWQKAREELEKLVS